MNNLNNDILRNKLKNISEILDELEIESKIINPEKDIVFLLLGIPPQNNIRRDTQIYYIPIDDDNNNDKFLLQIVSSFDISGDDMPLGELQTICDAINLKSPIGTLFMDPEDKGLYCRYTLVDVDNFVSKKVIENVLEIYLITLTTTCNLISELKKD